MLLCCCHASPTRSTGSAAISNGRSTPRASIDVAVDLGLGRATTLDGGAIDRLYGSLGLLTPTDRRSSSAPLADAAFFDLRIATRSSAASPRRARTRGRCAKRSAPTCGSSSTSCTCGCGRCARTPAWTGRTHYLSRSVIEGIHLFQGITDATMGHGEGWQYLQAGRFLERAASTAALLDLFLADATEPGRPAALDQAEWVALLRSCSALEAYCRHYTADRPAGARRRVPAAQRRVSAIGAVCGGEPRIGAAGHRASRAAAAPADAPSGSPAGCTPRSTTARSTRFSATTRTATWQASAASARRSTRR